MPHSSGRNPVFAGAVAACGAMGCGAGLLASSVAPAPEYALGSMLIYKFEIGLVVFLGLYLAIVLVRLAYHGRTPTRIGASGADLPDISTVSGALSELRATADLMSAIPREVAEHLAQLEQRLAVLEQRWTAEGDRG